jgi:hypothetical protein
MGALSSWAMLALTHHFIVQWAHWRVCQRIAVPYTWCSDYAVLGDDVVIVGRALSDEYQLIMKELGVGIGLHKSVLATTLSAEFAKRFVWNGVDVSPISFSEMGVARRSLGSALELRRRHGISNSAFYRVLGVGPFAITRMEKPRSARIEAYQLMLDWPLERERPFIHSNLFRFQRGKRLREPWGYDRFTYLHRLAYLLAASLVDAYCGLVRRLASLPPARMKLVEDKWYASAMEDTNLVAAANLTEEYSQCFSPSGGFNEAVLRLEELDPELEEFVAKASTVGLWDVSTLYNEYSRLATKVASVRVPTENEEFRVVLDSQVTEERVPLTLRFLLRFSTVLRWLPKAGIHYGVRDYPGSARREARFLTPWDSRIDD